MLTVNLSLVNILQIVFLAQSIFSIVVLSPHNKNLSLIYVLSASALLMFLNLLEEKGITYDYYLITPVFSLLFGPLFYFLVRQLTLNERPKKEELIIHIAPTLICLLFTHYSQLVLAFGTVSQLIYFFFSLKLLKLHRDACLNTCSNALALQVNWLKNIILAMITITVVDLLRLNLQPYLDLTIANYWYFTMQLAFYFLTSYLIVQAVWQPERFTGLQHYIEQQKLEIKNIGNAKAVYSEIQKLIISERLYKEPRLSLQHIVQRTGLTSKDISWAINSGSQLNFCDYINSHRVEYIKTQLTNNNDYNLLQVALKSGFNSKSSFNKSFKKHTGLTPTQFIKGIKS